MTNGEKFKEVFKTSDVDEGELYAFVWLSKHDEVAEINIDWWNAEYKEPTTKNDLPHCQHTDEEIAKSFIEDVEAVNDQLPCGEQMDFPNTFDEFAKDYGFKDKDEIYTNGSELIPVFRVKQWLEHISTTKNDLGVEKTDMIDKSNFSQEQYKADLQSAYDSGYEQAKNDLGVDAVSRADAKKAIIDHQYSNNFCEEHNIDHSINTSMALIALSDLPTVTALEPRKGHWICDGKGRSFADYHCSECGHKLALCGQDIKQRQDSGYSLFCDGCGADMREVEE